MEHIISLSALKTKKSVDKRDFLQFLKTISSFSKNFSDYTYFLSFSQIVKDWISSFEKIFSKSKINVDLKSFISKLCNTVTKLFSKLSECFHLFEPDYIQEFYSHWRDILCVIKASSRAKSCVQNIDQLKITSGHLRTAKHRLEQMTIFDVLRSYTEKISLDKLNELKLNHDGQDLNAIIEIAKMEKKSLFKSLHIFLTSISVNSNNIFTVKPFQAFPVVSLNLNDLKEKHEVWLDFNLKDRSVSFVALSLIHHEFLCLGIVAFPKINDYALPGQYQVIVSGTWNLLSKIGEDNTNTGESSKIVFLCHPNVKDMVLQLKNVFEWTPYRGLDIAEVQDKNLDVESVVTKTMIFNELDDYDTPTHPTPAKVARTNSTSSFSHDWSSFESSGGEESEMFISAFKHIHDIRPSKTNYNYHDDSLRVNYNSNAAQNSIVNKVDYNKMLSKGKLKWESCVPLLMEAHTNAIPPEPEDVQKQPNASSQHVIPGQIKTRRLTYVINTIETPKNVFMSMAVNCESHNIQLNETDDMADNVQNNNQDEEVELNSEYIGSIGTEFAKPDVSENYDKDLAGSEKSSSISHQSISDNENESNIPITLHLQKILDVLKTLTQSIERLCEILG